MEFWRRS